MKLSELKEGQKALITSIDLGFSFAQRLIEMGFSEGTEVTAAIKGMNSLLTAYKVKNTVIALRKETADKINVSLNLGGYDDENKLYDSFSR